MDKADLFSPDRAKDRFVSLDALRGLIMVLMAVDHAGFFVGKLHSGEFWGLPLPRYADALAFLTRWVTHICAPGFFFLMGAGMILFAAARRKAGWSENRITRFFVIRGALLILLQMMVENPAWLLGTLGDKLPMAAAPGGGGEVLFHFGVLYGLGANMIVLALLMRAGAGLVALVSVGSILATQWLTPSAAEAGVLYSPLLRILLIPGQTGPLQSYYPLIPWLAPAGFGVVFGRLLCGKGPRALRRALPAGVGLLGLFVLLRWMGGFGNIHAGDGGWIAFLNVTKYPPSLAFLSLTLGADLVLLFVASRIEPALLRAGRPLLVFGRSALFFYIAHMYLYGALGLAFPGGASYPVIYLAWLAGLAILFPLCVWYGTFKAKKPIESVWKLF